MEFPEDEDSQLSPKRKQKRKKSVSSKDLSTAVIEEPALSKRKSRRTSKLEIEEVVKEKRHSRKSMHEKVIPAASDTMRARQLRRKESNLSNSSSSRT